MPKTRTTVSRRLRVPLNGSEFVTGPGVRVDTGVAEGDVVPAEFDSMIAKIIAYGQSRKEALSRLDRALRESVVVIKGGASNKAFLLELLNRDEVKRGKWTSDGWTGWPPPASISPRRYADVALVQAAIEAYAAELAVEQTQFYASALRGRPQVRTEVGRTVELRYRGQFLLAQGLSDSALRHFRVEVDGSRIDAHLDRLGQFEYWLTAFGRRFHVVSIAGGLITGSRWTAFPIRIDRDDGGIVRSPSPAVVVSIAVKAATWSRPAILWRCSKP